MIRIMNLKMAIERPETHLKSVAAKYLHIEESDILSFTIEKKSLDARPRSDGNILYTYSVDLETVNEEEILAKNINNVRAVKAIVYTPPKTITNPPKLRPIVVGAGPAGLAAGLLLAECGYAPIVIERGENIEERTESVENFGRRGFKLNSNIQFGEGGAAAFSAGLFRKFTKDERIRKLMADVLLTPEVDPAAFYDDQTFLGSDVVTKIVKNIRDRITDFGGEIIYNTYVENLLVVSGEVKGVITEDARVHYSDHVVIATGLAARDTYRMLHSHQVEMMPMPFAIGLRIEHPKEVLNRAQYREYAFHPNLKPAGYSLSHHTKSGRNVYPFAISPGGQLIPSATEYGGLMVSGTTKSTMSLPNTNSALVVQLNLNDFEGGPDDIFAGVEFQRKLEHKAFVMGGSNYMAPAQLLGDFMNKQPSTAIGSVKPSYGLGVTLCNLHDLLPDFICDALIEAIKSFGKKVRGFDMPDAVLTGIESRPAAPIRVIRDKTTLQSPSIQGLFLAGDGTGYASGIISSHVDGIKVAEAVIASYEALEQV